MYMLEKNCKKKIIYVFEKYYIYVLIYNLLFIVLVCESYFFVLIEMFWILNCCV